MNALAYLAINPLGKVPAITHRGAIVTECAAICAYLADAFPEASLAPPPPDRAAYYRWMFFAAGPLEAGIINRDLGVEVAEDKRAMVGYGDHATMLDALEGAVLRTDHVAGDAFSACRDFPGAAVSGCTGIAVGVVQVLAPLRHVAVNLMKSESVRRQ